MTRAFQEQAHGGRLAWGLGDVLDLSVNVNPYGPPPELLAHLREVPFREYPDPTSRLMREQLAHRFGETPEHFLIGNGANELLWAAARACLAPRSDARRSVFTCFEPCYSEFARAASATLAQAAPLAFTPESYGLLSEDSLLAHIDASQTNLVYLCNPNSPTGAYIEPELIEGLLAKRPDLIVVLDESFLSLSHHHAAASRIYPPQVLRIVSLTKDFALAGLRIGYARGAPALIARLQAEIPTWSVNALAQAAGLWCLQHENFLTHSRTLMLADARALREALLQRQLGPGPLLASSSTIFMMVAIPEASARAQKLLLEQRILVRSCASYGYPGYWRIAARPAVEREQFLRALDLVLEPSARPKNLIEPHLRSRDL